MDKTYAPVTTAQELTEALAKCRAAQEKFATYTQEQVDKIFLAAATAANQMRIPLAKQAVAETGMGVVEDKVIKNHYAAEYIYNAYKDSKTCGVIEEDTAYGIQRIAEPIGVIAAVIPTTNPTSTAIFKTLISLKTRNGIIISPHPRAKKLHHRRRPRWCWRRRSPPVRRKASSAWIDEPSLELTNQVMREADLILATGGPGMVKAAYSSGKPALGVGAGNTPAVIDDSADILLAVNSIIHSKTFDNGMICASEQSRHRAGQHLRRRSRRNSASAAATSSTRRRPKRSRKTILDQRRTERQDRGTVAPIPSRSWPALTSLKDTKILIGEVTSVDISRSSLPTRSCPPCWPCTGRKTFDDAMDKADTLDRGRRLRPHSFRLSGHGDARRRSWTPLRQRMKACRILVNTPSSHGGIGDLYNFKLAPSLTLGCGSWGGNSVSENVGVKHLLNIKTVAERRENMLWFRAPEKVYFKKGCLPVALR